MNRFNPISTSIQDLVNYMQRDVDYKRQTKSEKKGMGKSSFFIDHNLECAEKILALLKKYKKDPQANLFQELQKIKR